MTIKKKSTAVSSKRKNADFEKTLTELKDIQDKLEDPSLPLEKSIELFERGSALINICRTTLIEAEQRVKILTKQDAEPKPYKRTND